MSKEPSFKEAAKSIDKYIESLRFDMDADLLKRESMVLQVMGSNLNYEFAEKYYVREYKDEFRNKIRKKLTNRYNGLESDKQKGISKEQKKLNKNVQTYAAQEFAKFEKEMETELTKLVMDLTFEGKKGHFEILYNARQNELEKLNKERDKVRKLRSSLVNTNKEVELFEVKYAKKEEEINAQYEKKFNEVRKKLNEDLKRQFPKMKKQARKQFVEEHINPKFEKMEWEMPRSMKSHEKFRISKMETFNEKEAYRLLLSGNEKTIARMLDKFEMKGHAGQQMKQNFSAEQLMKVAPPSMIEKIHKIESLREDRRQKQGTKTQKAKDVLNKFGNAFKGQVFSSGVDEAALQTMYVGMCQMCERADKLEEKYTSIENPIDFDNKYRTGKIDREAPPAVKEFGKKEQRAAALLEAQNIGKTMVKHRAVRTESGVNPVQNRKARSISKPLTPAEKRNTGWRKSR